MNLGIWKHLKNGILSRNVGILIVASANNDEVSLKDLATWKHGMEHDSNTGLTSAWGIDTLRLLDHNQGPVTKLENKK